VPELAATLTARGRRLRPDEGTAASLTWNTGADFAALFAALAPEVGAVVRTRYDRAGLDLTADPALVNEFPRIEPDPAGVEYARESTFDDTLVRPLLFMTTTAPWRPARARRARATCCACATYRHPAITRSPPRRSARH
jgi:hypothetical protein